jgi:hypothetical protein
MLTRSDNSFRDAFPSASRSREHWAPAVGLGVHLQRHRAVRPAVVMVAGTTSCLHDEIISQPLLVGLPGSHIRADRIAQLVGVSELIQTAGRW